MSVPGDFPNIFEQIELIFLGVRRKPRRNSKNEKGWTVNFYSKTTVAHAVNVSPQSERPGPLPELADDLAESVKDCSHQLEINGKDVVEVLRVEF